MTELQFIVAIVKIDLNIDDLWSRLNNENEVRINFQIRELQIKKIEIYEEYIRDKNCK